MTAAMGVLDAMEWVADAPPAPKPLVEPVELPALAERGPMQMLDAAYECEHGRLPHDRLEQADPCGCWRQSAPLPEASYPTDLAGRPKDWRPVPTPAITAEEAGDLASNAGLESEDKPDEMAGAGPLVVEGLAGEIVRQLDAEIDRLRATRERIIKESDHE